MLAVSIDFHGFSDQGIWAWKSSTNKFLVFIRVSDLNIELTVSYPTMRVWDHAEYIDDGHEKLANH